MTHPLTPREKVERFNARRKAYTQVKLAIDRGDLRIPSSCEFCGCDPGAAKDGRRALQADHHNGYERALDVRWLCPPCHRSVTPFNPARGAARPEAKLTDELVAWIRSIPTSNRKVAAVLGVDYSTIQHARSGRTWKHVPMPK